MAGMTKDYQNFVERMTSFDMNMDEVFGSIETEEPEEKALTHHGVMGQRWGIRRYQNPDGTLTPAGERRAMRDSMERRTRGAIPVSTHVYQMSDAQIQAANQRLGLLIDSERKVRELEQLQKGPVRSAVEQSMLRVGTSVLEKHMTASSEAFITQLNTKAISAMTKARTARARRGGSLTRNSKPPRKARWLL